MNKSQKKLIEAGESSIPRASINGVASETLALAGLSAKGKTKVRGLEHLERGYEDFSEKLQGVRAKILKKNKNYV